MLAALGLALALALPGTARGAATFTVDPDPPTVCQTADFTAQPDPLPGETVTGYDWELNGDGQFDDVTTVDPAHSHTFTSPGVVKVGVRVSYADDTQTPPVTRTEEFLRDVTVPAAPPVASFTRSPLAPLTFDPVTYVSTSTVPAGQVLLDRTWDLNGDGVFGEATAATASTSYAVPGPRIVRLRVQSGCGGGVFSGETAQLVQIGNRQPTASIRLFPIAPVVGEAVDFISLARDPDGPIVSELWDLNGDGRFDDASGPTGRRVFTAAGTKSVSLRAVDASGAAATAFASFNVAPLAPAEAPLLSPFPVVRLAGELLPKGTRINLLAIRTPRGSRVTIKCSGDGCPYRRRSVRTSSSRLRVRSFKRLLEPRAKVRIYVTKPDTIGKYTSFRIRSRRRPARRDLCLKPGATRPSRCPAG